MSAAEMVNSESRWNAAYLEFVREAMGKVGLAMYPEYAVSVSLPPASPQPTPLCLIYLRPETRRNLGLFQ